jgi:hypothetical protein
LCGDQLNESSSVVRQVYRTALGKAEAIK